MGVAVVRGLRANNPVIGVKRFPSKKMERFLSPVELGRLGEALAAATALGVESRYAIAALKLLALTGCRKHEILKLKPSYVDTFHRCLRLPDSKTGAKAVHLGAPARRTGPM
jgi:integrase